MQFTFEKVSISFLQGYFKKLYSFTEEITFLPLVILRHFCVELFFCWVKNQLMLYHKIDAKKQVFCFRLFGENEAKYDKRKFKRGLVVTFNTEKS